MGKKENTEGRWQLKCYQQIRNSSLHTQPIGLYPLTIGGKHYLERCLVSLLHFKPPSLLPKQAIYVFFFKAYRLSRFILKPARAAMVVCSKFILLPSDKITCYRQLLGKSYLYVSVHIQIQMNMFLLKNKNGVRGSYGEMKVGLLVSAYQVFTSGACCQFSSVMCADAISILF